MARDGKCGYSHWGNAFCPLQLPSALWQRHRDGQPNAPAAFPLGPALYQCGEQVYKAISCALLYTQPVCVWMHFPLVGKSTAEPGIFWQLQNIFFSSGGKVLCFYCWRSQVRSQLRASEPSWYMSEGWLSFIGIKAWVSIRQRYSAVPLHVILRCHIRAFAGDSVRWDVPLHH